MIYQHHLMGFGSGTAAKICQFPSLSGQQNSETLGHPKDTKIRYQPSSEFRPPRQVSFYRPSYTKCLFWEPQASRFKFKKSVRTVTRKQTQSKTHVLTCQTRQALSIGSPNLTNIDKIQLWTPRCQNKRCTPVKLRALNSRITLQHQSSKVPLFSNQGPGLRKTIVYLAMGSSGNA